MYLQKWNQKEYSERSNQYSFKTKYFALRWEVSHTRGLYGSKTGFWFWLIQRVKFVWTCLNSFCLRGFSFQTLLKMALDMKSPTLSHKGFLAMAEESSYLVSATIARLYTGPRGRLKYWLYFLHLSVPICWFWCQVIKTKLVKQRDSFLIDKIKGRSVGLVNKALGNE